MSLKAEPMAHRTEPESSSVGSHDGSVDGSSSSSSSSSSPTRQVRRRDSVADVLCAACAQVRDMKAVDVGQLAQANPCVMEFTKQVCAKILEAKQHIKGATVSKDPEVTECYVPWLRASTRRDATSAPANKMLTDTVTTLSAFLCLKHILKHSSTNTSPILKGLGYQPQHKQHKPPSVLPAGTSEQLSKDLFMILHSRNCTEDDCSLQFCAGMKDFLHKADEKAWNDAKDDVLYLKQLEKHHDRCRSAMCQVCKSARERVESQQKLAAAQGLEQLRESTESLDSSAASSQARRARNRQSRSVSMPPRPDAATQMQMLQAQQQQLQSQQYGNLPMMMQAYQQQPMWSMMHMQQQYPPMMFPGATQGYPFMGYPMSPQMMHGPGPVLTTMAQASSPSTMPMQQDMSTAKSPAPPSLAARLRSGRSKAHSTPVQPHIDEMDEDEDEDEEDNED